MYRLNLTGMTVGSRKVLAYQGNGVWSVQCECGKRSQNKSTQLLKTFACKSCAKVRHGHTKEKNNSGAYKSWSKMRRRCDTPSNNRYEDYGGRGITVCPRWEVFDNFLEDMGDRPEGTTIDRIDPNGNYEPGNVKWSTPKEQANNRRPRKRRISAY